MKCQLKPIVLECFQWTGGLDQTEDPEWIVEAIEKGNAWFRHHPQRGFLLVIHTQDGDMEARPGDYIIQGKMVGIFPIKAETFKDIYEVAEERKEVGG